jgi:nicotinate-nucleotide adenylyltransferase
MVGADARLQSDSVEVDRDGLSYTVDTLREFARRLPSAERYFLVGADVLASFAQWRDPQTVLELATLGVLTRRCEDGAEPAVEPRAVDRGLADALAQRSSVVPTRRIDVSSTEIRDRVRSGRSIHGFVTDTVGEYISSHGLYR